MTLAQKYLFEVSFDQPEEPAAAERKAPPEPTFTRAELEAARAEGAAHARSAALAEAAQTTDSRTAAALTTIETGIAALLEARVALVSALEQQALVLLRATLAKALPALCRKDPLAEIEALVARCLGEALDEPRIVVRVGDALFDPIQKRLGVIAQANGFAGKFVLLAEPALAECDARIEWADGGAERDTSRLAAQIDAVLARALTPPPSGPSPSEENPDG